MLASTHRFLVIAGRIRDLHSRYRGTSDVLLMRQIENLRKRVMLIRDMQAIGIPSPLLCVVCMFVLFAGYPIARQIYLRAPIIFTPCSYARVGIAALKRRQEGVVNIANAARMALDSAWR